MSETPAGSSRRSAGTSRNDQPAPGTLGTFTGVFTPSILTILGIILFLRLGYVVGAAGLPRALVIILAANAISVLTSISLSAIATNLRVKGGGDYYLISRTLGIEYGGALGIVLYLAQSVSIAFYVVGFAEAVTAIVGTESLRVNQAIAAVAVAGLFALAWMGADWASRFQFAVMGVIFIAITGFVIGGIGAWDAAQLQENMTPASVVPFWTLFAIFFPAVTGFTQGVSMSGDLKDPGRSLPLGTFSAVGLSLVVYVALAVIFAAAIPGARMVSDTGAMREVSILSWLVDAGVIAATLSSALASFLGAPRILQSLAADRIFPFLSFFAKGHGPTSNPRRGVVLSAIIAFATIALGNLNLIAAVVSMFFLISYGLLNYATFFEAQANSPFFRPRFRFFHKRLSLAGCVACLIAMIAIHPTAGAVAVAVLYSLHQYVARSAGVSRWSDSSRSRRIQRVREDLHAISADLPHARDWRPVVLAFSDSSDRRGRLLRFASWLEGGSGFTTAVRLVPGSGVTAERERRKAEEELKAEILRHELPAFAKAVVAENIPAAVPVLLQSHGIGQVRANTVLLNWYDRKANSHGPELKEYGRTLRLGLRYGCNVVILAAGSNDFVTVEKMKRSRRRIDVWYRRNDTGRLTLLLAYLMTRSELFEDARIRLFVGIQEGEDPKAEAETIRELLEDVRIAAEVEIVEQPDRHAVVRHSADSAVVFLPFRLEENEPVTLWNALVDDLVRELGITALVLAAQDIALDSEPEEGHQARLAEILDSQKRAEKTAAEAEAEAEAAAEAAATARQRLDNTRAGDRDPEGITKLEEGLKKTEETLVQAKRRAARARAKAEDAAKEASALTGRPADAKETG